MKIKRIFQRVGTACLFLLAINASAVAQEQNDPLVKELSNKLNLQISAIGDSPVPGLKQVFTSRGLFYVSDDGNFFLQARVYDLANGMRDETEHALKSVRLEGIDKFKDSAIEFTAKDEQYVINVFTDATCGYCRKLHNEMQQYNDLGITVRYLAWPRAGVNSAVYRDTVSIWCSENPQKAMTDAKAGKAVNDANCENQVAEQFRFGQQIGVNGTPNIVLPDGTVVPGYQPAAAIAKTLREAS